MKLYHTINAVILFFGVILSSSCAQDVFKKISKQVDLEQRHGQKTDKPTFHDIRLKVYKDARAAFLKSDIDTLFLLEAYSIEDGAYYGKIWDKKNGVVYKSQNGKIQYDVITPFTGYMSSLIQKWDTAGIRLEESLHSDMMPQQWIYGARVFKKANKYTVDLILFKRFFKVERDRY
jgi:hypothetical protein